MNFYVNIAISAGIGTALVEIVTKLFLEHFLKEEFYKFKIRFTDKRDCANELLNLVSFENSCKWITEKSLMYSKAYSLADRLDSLGEHKFAKKVTAYVTKTCIMLDLLSGLLGKNIDAQREERIKHYLKTATDVAHIRQELTEIARKLK